MNPRRACALLLIAVAGHAGTAAAQDVIRCGNAYGQQPCAGGTVVPVADPRSDAQRAHARAATKRDAMLAARMEKTRLKAEAHAGAAQKKTLQTAAPKAPVAASEPKQPVVFKARVPSQPSNTELTDSAGRKKKNKLAAALPGA